jgi:hypothetical protein
MTFFSLRDVHSYLNRIGEQVVADYQPGVSRHNVCFRDSYARVRRASRYVASTTPLPAWDQNLEFCRLWGSLIRKDGVWMDFPEKYRGLGAPGALASRGWATIIDQNGIWSGLLDTGAVLQTWRVRADHERVQQGKKPLHYGHSFVFREYVRRGSGIIGMKVADNGYHGRRTVTPGTWGFWVGANLYSG